MSKTLNDILFYEQDLIFRCGDYTRLYPHTSEINSMYLPEAKNIFKLKSYWLNKSDILLYLDAEHDQINIPEVLRNQADFDKFLYLVHPYESIDLEKFTLTEDVFFGSTTSSVRTLLVWKEHQPDKPFYAKLNLPVRMGGDSRLLNAEIISRSVGTSKTLNHISKNNSFNFNILRESIGIVPKSIDSDDVNGGGMIIRPIYNVNENHKIVPFFSILSNKVSPALIIDLAIKKDMPLSRFIKEEILHPFCLLWFKLVCDEGVIPEPHAQNLLLELNENDSFTGSFFHRDLEAFYIDFKFRESTGKYLPKHLPSFLKNIAVNYKQDGDFRLRGVRSIYNYFIGGVVYPLDQFIVKSFNIDYTDEINKNNSESLERAFNEMIISEFNRRYDEKIQLTSKNDYYEMMSKIWEYRI